MNIPVQGIAAEVLLAALGRLPHWLSGLDARLVLRCHDELLLDSAEQGALAVEAPMTGGMAEAWRRFFPEAVVLGIREAHTGHPGRKPRGDGLRQRV
jgi:DNA polymerase I-like protein with 3'-5' exonuclease and polymerase domains